MKLFCAIFMLYQNVFCYFRQTSEEGKKDIDNEFKISWATYCSRTILDMFISSQLFHFYLIHFYSHGISSSKNTLCIGILAHLKRPLKNVSPWAYFRGFAVPYFNRYVDLTNLQFNRTCNLKLQSDVDMLLDIFEKFSEQLFIRQLWPASIKCKLLYFEKQSFAKKAF